MSDAPYGAGADPDPAWQSHIDRLNPGVNPAHIPGQGPPAQETDEMTPDQFTEFKALVTDFLTPVREVALRHLAWMEEQQPIPQMPNVAPPPDLSPDVQDWEPTDLTGNDGLPMVFSPSLNVYRSASRLEAASSYDGDAPPEPGNRGDERSADTAPTGDAAAV